MGNELITRDQLQSDLENLYNNKISPYLNGATHTGFTPIGTVIDFLGTTAPSHYLECDGSIYNIADYSDLANYFETTYGSKNYFGGNGTITFAVPTITGDGDIIKCICAINNFIDYALDGFPVAVTNPQDKQGLTFDATTQKWVNGAGGLHEYSTNEHVVGTWIDGRPLYEKTITLAINANSTDNTERTTFNSYSDVGLPSTAYILEFCSMTQDEYAQILNCVWGQKSYYRYFTPLNTQSKFMYSCNRQSSAINIKITVKYIDTTDTPTVQS